MASRVAYEVETQTPGLGQAALQEARELIGVVLRRADHEWNRYASPDTVRHFDWGVGDDNPLFCDEEYGGDTRWGSGIAPGCYLYTVDSTIVAPKLRGVQWIYTGTDWEWYEPIKHWDEFRAEVRLVDAQEKSGSKASKFIIQTGECLFYNAKTGRLVAKALGHTARIPRAKADGGLSYEPREPHKYKPDELEAIEDDIANEVVTGADTLFWDNVSVGDPLPPVVKGPLNITDMIAWYSTGHIYKAHERAVRYRWRHPADAFQDPDTGAQDHPARGHTQAYMAQEVGMPGIYDIGPQRISWCNHLLTNWIGDDGFLRRLNVQVRRPNVLGDTTWVRGNVISKNDQGSPDEIDGNGPYRDVEIEVWCENQLGELTAQGTATAALLCRD